MYILFCVSLKEFCGDNNSDNSHHNAEHNSDIFVISGVKIHFQGEPGGSHIVFH
jgi:hypothetical protein